MTNSLKIDLKFSIINRSVKMHTYKKIFYLPDFFLNVQDLYILNSFEKSTDNNIFTENSLQLHKYIYIICLTCPPLLFSYISHSFILHTSTTDKCKNEMWRHLNEYSIHDM